MRADISTGARFPDYELPDQTGKRRRLSEIQGHDPMIVVLSRGHYCPKDRRQLRNLVELYPEIKVAYTKVVTISTDNLMETNEMRDALGAAWPFLSDPKRIIQKDLEIQEYTDPQHDPMIPYTLVLGPGLKIHSIYNGYWYWGRPSNEDLRRDLRELTRLSRPDWDITAPGRREQWEAGARDDFWPYGRSMREVFASLDA
ncbi:MAG TPA: redoxin domain-containing protein [Candidatus Limnocylindrales bacterium]|nr:redoxin domain-containing protein [Candidatus Limnocylindrales bacterium]